jgi:hypothetical protein
MMSATSQPAEFCRPPSRSRGARRQRSLRLGDHRDGERGPRYPADVPDRTEKDRAVVPVQQQRRDVAPGRNVLRQRVPAELVQDHRQADDCSDQRH